MLAALFGLAVLLLVGFGLFAAFQIAYETAVGKFTDRIEAAKVFFPILLALVGGPLLIWRVITAHIQAQATRHQAETGREAHYTSLFTKAVEQLGSTREVKETIEVDDEIGGKKRETATKTEPNLEVQLGAIHALDRVARDSSRDHWPIMEVLCAYVRNPQNTGLPKLKPGTAGPDSEDFSAWWQSIKMRVDVQAALTVVGHRSESNRKIEAVNALHLDFHNANLQRGMLNRCNFDQANFAGADLAYASFYDSHLAGASFNNAHLSAVSFDNAHLDGASFFGAHLVDASFKGAHLRGVLFDKANLSDAKFYGVRSG